MYEFTFGKVTATVGSITKNEGLDTTLEPEGELYSYLGFSVVTSSGEKYGFSRGYITPDHLKDLEGTESEQLEAFFESLCKSYDYRDSGDTTSCEKELAKINIAATAPQPVEVTLSDTSKTKSVTSE